MESDELRRLLLVATIVALSLTALIAVVALLAADFGETELRILATTAGLGLVSLADGRRIERNTGADLPDAVASALRELQERDERVTRIEFGVG